MTAPAEFTLADLSPEERFLLGWLAKEDESTLGECQGKSLSALVGMALAEIEEVPAAGLAEYGAVTLTERGRQLASEL